MKKKIYGVVVIGCGHIGQEHLHDICFRENIRVVAVVDFNIELARECARKYSGGNHVECGTDYHEFIKRDDVDIVIVATYANTHFDILKACIAAGKHVVCEKPIAPTYEEAEEFCRAVKESKICVLIAHILRHNTLYQKAGELIREGLIGDIRLVRMAQNHHILDRPRYMNLLSSCSPIVDCGVHYVDVIRWMTGLEVTEWSGKGAVIDPTIPEGTYDYGMIQMRLSNGGMAHYEACWASTIETENLKEFVGTKGRMRLILAENRGLFREEGNLLELYTNDGGRQEINVEGEYKDMYAQLCCLIDMIENGSEGTPTLEEAMFAFRVVTECDKMAREQLQLP
ncbi:MAG: Gfo/Idh/MocA family oxidoreductase [Clostridia bacterium]|nr:Gfo/Idh/MocA family oxidoreductase [Clostridia bacterium]